MLKFNNNDIRTTPLALCLYCQLSTFFTPCSSISFVNFEHVIAGWVKSEECGTLKMLYG